MCFRKLSDWVYSVTNAHASSRDKPIVNSQLLNSQPTPDSQLPIPKQTPLPNLQLRCTSGLGVGGWELIGSCGVVQLWSLHAARRLNLLVPRRYRKLRGVRRNRSDPRHLTA